MTSASDLPAPHLALPRAAALMLWTAASVRGDIGPDDAAVLAHGVGRTAVSRDQGEDLFTWITGLRRLPAVQLRLVLPRPGRIAGLVGPPAAVTDAIAAGQAIIVAAADLADHTLVPVQSERRGVGPDGEVGTVVQWRRHPAPVGRALGPAADGGREQLLHALHRAAASSLDWDLVPEEPVTHARMPHGWAPTALPRHLEPTVLQQITLAARVLLLVEDELADPRPQAVSLTEQGVRSDMLEDMRDAATAALVDTVDRVTAEALLGR